MSTLGHGYTTVQCLAAQNLPTASSSPVSTEVSKENSEEEGNIGRSAAIQIPSARRDFHSSLKQSLVYPPPSPPHPPQKKRQAWSVNKYLINKLL